MKLGMIRWNGHPCKLSESLDTDTGMRRFTSFPKGSAFTENPKKNTGLTLNPNPCTPKVRDVKSRIKSIMQVIYNLLSSAQSPKVLGSLRSTDKLSHICQIFGSSNLNAHTKQVYWFINIGFRWFEFKLWQFYLSWSSITILPAAEEPMETSKKTRCRNFLSGDRSVPNR